MSRPSATRAPRVSHLAASVPHYARRQPSRSTLGAVSRGGHRARRSYRRQVRARRHEQHAAHRAVVRERRRRRRSERRNVFHQRIGLAGKPELNRAEIRLFRRALRARAALPQYRRHELAFQRQLPLMRQTYTRNALDLIRDAQHAGVAPHARLPKFKYENKYSKGLFSYSQSTPYAARVMGVGRRRIHIAPRTLEGAFAPSSRRDRRYNRHVVLHEWAHTLQRKGMDRGPTEAGAENFKIYAERKLRRRPSTRVYPQRRRALREQLRGRTGRFVRRDQFDPELLLTGQAGRAKLKRHFERAQRRRGFG